MYEIERKFLLTRPIRDIIREQARLQNWMACENIQQVYLPKTDKWAIRARMTQVGEFAMLRTGPLVPQYLVTMKRKKTKLTSIEIEHNVFASTYEQFVEVCGHRPINKNRWHYYQKEDDGRELMSHFMIDEFLNPELGGLVVAEIELENEKATFTRPDFLGEEVTGVKGYSNASMVGKLKL